MECLIRVIKGPDQGREHRLGPGGNLIGRGNKAALKLTPEDISWEHALVTRQGDEYFLENLSAMGTWIGDAKVSGRVRLRPRDQIRLSKETVLRLEPAEGEASAGGRWLLWTLAAVAAAALGWFIWREVGSGTSAQASRLRAYNLLLPWVREQASARPPRIAPEAVTLMEEAWRLERARDYAHSRGLWLRLQVLLDAAEKDLHCMELSLQPPHANALRKLLSPPSPQYDPTDEEMAAAMAQFIQDRLENAVKRLPKSGLGGGLAP